MLLGAKLLKLVLNAVKLLNKEITVHAWNDSTIAICWIRSTSSKYSVFVANRIAKIQQQFPKEIWNHVPTESNPADHCTRPVEPSKLKSLEIWWKGPKWLHEEPICLPKQPEILETVETRKELKRREPASIHVVDDTGHSPDTAVSAGGLAQVVAENKRLRNPPQ